MSSFVETLNEVIRNLYLYVGATEVIFGTIGNILTLVVYSRHPLRNTRTAPYIMLLAVLNTIFLDWNAIPRFIVTLQRQTDTTFGIEFLCPLRTTILWSCLTIIMLLLPWLAFDRYLSSCRQASRRRWSNRKVMRNGLMVIVAFAILTNWPFIFYARAKFDSGVRIVPCALVNPIYTQFHVYFQTMIIFSMLPAMLLAMFGFMTLQNIRNVKQTSNQLERQMTRVLTLQTVLNVCALIPYCASNLYGFITTNEPKTLLHRTVQQLSSVVVLHFYYLMFSSSFYTSVIASKEVRRQFQAVIYFRRQPTNQIGPLITSVGFQNKP